MADKQDIANLIALFKAAWPNYNPDLRITAELMTRTLGDIPGETLQSAGLALVTEYGRAFAPSVGEIRAAAIKLNAQAAGIPDAQQAYAEAAMMPASMVARAVVEVEGRFYIDEKRLSWSHPFVGEIAALIGWPTRWPTSDAGTDRAQWVRFYEAQLHNRLNEAGRLPALNEYIERNRANAAGTLPGVGDLTKKLEGK